jgi:hypothetical protein
VSSWLPSTNTSDASADASATPMKSAWPCLYCTFLNTIKARRCKICLQPRGKAPTVQVPASDAPASSETSHKESVVKKTAATQKRRVVASKASCSPPSDTTSTVGARSQQKATARGKRGQAKGSVEVKVESQSTPIRVDPGMTPSMHAADDAISVPAMTDRRLATPKRVLIRGKTTDTCPLVPFILTTGLVKDDLVCF